MAPNIIMGDTASISGAGILKLDAYSLIAVQMAGMDRSGSAIPWQLSTLT
jgi:hypothetical protein